MHDDEADPEYEYVPVDLRSPPGWAEAFARAAELVVDAAGFPTAPPRSIICSASTGRHCLPECIRQNQQRKHALWTH
jgi:hypothetical protein